MDESTSYVEREKTQEPQHDENGEEREKHGNPFFDKRIGASLTTLFPQHLSFLFGNSDLTYS